MVVTNEVQLPEFKELTVEEVNLSSATLMAAAPHLGKRCESINNEFMLCRQEHDPRSCIQLGMKVTKCTLDFFRDVKANCKPEFNQYADCIDKSSGRYEPWHCRKTQAVFDKCMFDKLEICRPDFGYFTRARIHCSKTTEPDNSDYPPETMLPCLPDTKERKPARFGARNYWMME